MVATRSLDGAAKRTRKYKQRAIASKEKERHLVNDSMAFIDGFYPLLKTNRFAHYMPVLIIHFIGIFLLIVVDPSQRFNGKAPSVIMSIVKNLAMQRLKQLLAAASSNNFSYMCSFRLLLVVYG